MKSSTPLFLGSLAFALTTGSGWAGIVSPASDRVEWLEAASWNWKKSHQSKEIANQVPGDEDQVIITGTSPSLVSLKGDAPSVASILVGGLAESETYELILQPNANLGTQRLIVGRGGVNPAGQGRLIIETQATLTVEGDAFFGAKLAENSIANNGQFFLRGGTFKARRFTMGGAGTENGSMLEISGSKGAFHVEGLTVKGESTGERSAPATLRFQLDQDGVVSIECDGALNVADKPRLEIDCSHYALKERTVQLPLIRVTGKVTGEFAEAQFPNLPHGVKSRVEWEMGVLSLVLSR